MEYVKRWFGWGQVGVAVAGLRFIVPLLNLVIAGLRHGQTHATHLLCAHCREPALPRAAPKKRTGSSSNGTLRVSGSSHESRAANGRLQQNSSGGLRRCSPTRQRGREAYRWAPPLPCCSVPSSPAHTRRSSKMSSHSNLVPPAGPAGPGLVPAADAAG